MAHSNPGPRGSTARKAALRSIPVALGGYVLALVLSVVGLSLALAVGASDDGLVATIGGQVGLWSGFVGVPVWLSRVSGSGQLREDFGLSFRWFDLWGLPLGIATQFLVVPLFSLPMRFAQPDRDFSAPAREVLDRADGLGRVVIAALVIGIAPVAEELFFRGLLQQAALQRLRAPLAVGAVALFFGLTHFQPELLPPLVAAGMIFGICTWRTQRLGLTIVTHAAFNASTVAALWLTT